MPQKNPELLAVYNWVVEFDMKRVAIKRDVFGIMKAKLSCYPMLMQATPDHHVQR